MLWTTLLPLLYMLVLQGVPLLEGCLCLGTMHIVTTMQVTTAETLFCWPARSQPDSHRGRARFSTPSSWKGT